MDHLSYINYPNAEYIDSLYLAYQQDHESVEFGLQKFFEGFDLGSTQGPSVPRAKEEITGNVTASIAKEIAVSKMIEAYRSRGHLFARTNPVRERRKHMPGNELESFGLSDNDLDTLFSGGSAVGLGTASLRDIRNLLEQTYSRSIGAEYKYIDSPVKVKWFEDRMEPVLNTPEFSLEKKKRILNKLNEAVGFENFLGTKFLGQKRFSLEGAEGLIPAMDALIEKGADMGLQEIIIGMGHRGRLNVLANMMGKPYKEIFSEFQGKSLANDDVSGDVKYHLGYSNDVTTLNGKTVHLSLCPNPSHLEAVNAVVEGITRAKADTKYAGDFSKIVPVLFHGDASIAGQGVVYEVLQMENLAGYRTGGTIHVVINNQVGFTTDYKDGRSSTYCTDVAKVVAAPVFHVNGDDVEALVYVMQLALEYRQTFQADVFIDIVCYRKYGHNEADEPKFTQPLLYKAIEVHPNVKQIYIQKLIEESSINADFAAEIDRAFKSRLQVLLDEAKQEENIQVSEYPFRGAWKELRRAKDQDFDTNPDTSVSKEMLISIGNSITSLPKNKTFLKKIEKLFEDRKNSVNNTQVFDWAMAELLAYGSLLSENHPVRLSGEDVKRGTFSHRHAIAAVADSDEEFVPLNSLELSARFDVHNSLLSEYGVLGFEYGYALADPNTLVLWEAQFGDFLNTAQVIVDQYIASAEVKWQRGNGLVLLLPHGHEGAGPEHSSARIERFTDLAAKNNFQVVNCTTPANFFHVLRRQLHREFRVPLIVFTPKSLLRHPLCVSPLKEFTEERFKELIDDNFVNSLDVSRVLFCSGKMYYDLLEKQQKDNRKDVAIVRIEQLYPMPFTQMQAIKEKYLFAKEFIWVQEEPENMGAWPYICRKFRDSEINFGFIGRKESGSPATGFSKRHTAEQIGIIDRAYNTNTHTNNI